MRWVDFLVQVLKTQGRTLQRLSVLYGEDTLIEWMEAAGDEMATPDLTFQIESSWLLPAQPTQSTFSPLEALEQAARETELSAVLEFYLWTYPYYRTLVESPIDLRAEIQLKKNPEFIGHIVDEAVTQAKLWLEQLRLPVRIRDQAEKASLVLWVRFRSDALKLAGQRPMEINRFLPKEEKPKGGG